MSRRPTVPRSPGPGPGRSSLPGRRAAASAPAVASRRPAASARPRSGPTAPPVRAPRGLSRRAAVLAVLVLAVAAATAPIIRDFVNQQTAKAAAAADVLERRERVAALQDQAARWDDPAYVAAEARQRLGLVMPGERRYIVLPPPVPPGEPGAGTATSDPGAAGPPQADPPPVGGRVALDPAGSAEQAWFASVWDSLARAGADEAPPP